MYIERLLQVNIAALICLATLLVGMGQQSATMPLAMFAAALAAFWLNDFTGRVSLNRTMAGLAQVAVLLLMFFFSIELEKESLILTMGRLLVYWQMILLFEKKEVRTYWHQVQLSLLQVVVAALLVQGFLFGLLLIVYLFTALCALTLMFLYEERSRHHSAGKTAPPPAPNGGRWPLARQDLSFSGPAAGRLGVDRELFARMLKTASASLLLGILVFLLTPRFSHGAWRGLGGGVRGSVGFDDKVRLGALVSGSILQNPQEVLTIRFYRAEGDSGASPSDRIYSVDRDLYLRGAVLTHYEHGEWRSPLAWRSARGAFSGFQQLPGGREPVRQEITIEPLSRNDLFYVWPFSIPNEAVGMVDWDPQTNRLTRPLHFLGRQFTYELLTTAFDAGAQAAIVPNAERVNGIRRELTQMPAKDGRPTLPNLVALADDWTATSRLPAADRYHVALALEEKIRDSGRFQYSLEGTARDLALDPIEDFILKHPQGHCEYFATALALMLRSQGIPARVVVGYHTDEWNARGQCFVVRQLHAHTWVEAFLEPKDVPGELKLGPDAYQWSEGAWLRLDATPADDAPQSFLRTLSTTSWLYWFDQLWDRYVIQMDRSRQREAIYQPVHDVVTGVARSVGDLTWWRGLFKSIRGLLGLDRWTGLSGEWLDGLLATALAIGLFTTGHWGFRVTRAVWVRSSGGRRSAGKRSPRSQVAFYRRLESVLARCGMIRPVSHTQREFAREAETRLVQRMGDERLATIPTRVVEAFYRVRFGGPPLDKQEAEAVEQALVQLESATGKRVGIRSP
jgi:transglutaminase-like putative cysteine protease